MNHPKDYVNCPDCNADSDTWQKKRRLPQVNKTYECAECGHEVYAYDVAGQNEGPLLRWRPVTNTMATNLQFFDVVGDWPDSALTDLFKMGLERAEAIDYHIVETEGLSQSEWAEMTERSQPSVSENAAKAREKIDVELEIDTVYLRTAAADAALPSRIEIVEDENGHHDYLINGYDRYGNHLGTLHPNGRSDNIVRMPTLETLKEAIQAENQGYERADAEPGDLPPSTDERVKTFLESDRVQIDDDGTAYDRDIFNRWRKGGKDRLYVNDPGEGYLSLDGVDKSLTHPEAPIVTFGGRRGRTKTLDDGRKIIYATDGVSDHIVAVILKNSTDE